MNPSCVIAFFLVSGCAAEQPAPQTSEVGITVLPVTSSVAPLPIGLVTATTAATVAPTRAGDRELAERYFTEARAMMSANRVEQACGLFAKSMEADPAIGTMLNLADCNEKLGNLPAACDAYRDVEAQARASGEDARGELARSRAEKLGCR